MLKLGDTYERIFTVTNEVYNGFIAVFKDANPLHTNENFAVAKGFKGRVMHGNILNGFLSYFIGEVLPDKNVIIHSQEIQFKNPVYLDDTLTFSAEIIGWSEAVNMYQFKFSYKNNSAKVVAKGHIQIGMI